MVNIKIACIVDKSPMYVGAGGLRVAVDVQTRHAAREPSGQQRDARAPRRRRLRASGRLHRL